MENWARVWRRGVSPDPRPVDRVSLLVEHLAAMVNGRRLLSLRGEMITLPLGRRFILAYATLVALFNLSVLLPGNPVSSNGEFIVAVGV